MTGVIIAHFMNEESPHLFIYLGNIYWVTIICQAVRQALVLHGELSALVELTFRSVMREEDSKQINTQNVCVHVHMYMWPARWWSGC